MRKIIIFLLFILISGNALAQSADNVSPQQAYKNLLLEEQSVKNEIQSVTSMLSSLRGSKAKKAAKRLDQLVSEQESIQRKKMFFPESVRNEQNKQAIDDASREQVQRMVDEKVLAKGGTLDEDVIQEDEQAGEEYWSIVLSISDSPNASKYMSYGEVEVEDMAGRYIFFLGHFDTKSEADSRCKQIVKKGKCRDAFVVQRNK